MKKLIIACAAVLALGLVSCSDETSHCYKITTSYTIQGEPYSETGYVWMTKTVIKAYEKNQREVALSKGAENILVYSVITEATSEEECLHITRN